MTQPNSLKALARDAMTMQPKVEIIHTLGFTAFKQSKRFRFMIESTVTFVITILFQVYISEFTQLIHQTNKTLDAIFQMQDGSKKDQMM